MKVTCEKMNHMASPECKSIITIMSSSGEIVDRIAVPHDDGVLYCTENPETEAGSRYHKAIATAKVRDRKPFTDGARVWRCVKYLRPSKSGFFWVSDGVDVWAATVSTHAQANAIATQECVRFFLPITENAPHMPPLPTIH